MSIVTTRTDGRFVGTQFSAPERREAGILLRWAKRVIRQIQIQRQRRVLESMPDWILKDVGISRSDIDSISISLVDGSPDELSAAAPADPGRRAIRP
ncbi:MAG: DUF1127 domain-containing protein [Alphaproteobacteria bacterium]|nr:DUF1127 domain-containing protein [Alphaproteobacteria bacterium]